MEADGVPAGYDRWQKVGIVRDPVELLWSLYKFLENFGGGHDPAYIGSMRASVRMPFDDWIVHNETVFTSPYDCAGRGRFYPLYTVRHPIPENRKSQFLYLRPDLGTEVHGFDDLKLLARQLRLKLPRKNATRDEPPPQLSPTARSYVERVFEWDLQVTEGPSALLQPVKKEAQNAG